MIAVIADDFTGAAEIAGITLRFGLTVELTLGTVFPTNADVMIVCSDSRSMSVENAMSVTDELIRGLLKLNPEFIFKKIDSVLRGHVVEELQVQMNACRFKKGLVLPANPSLGRTIIDGEYFIDGTAISNTAFAWDPEFPVRTNHVETMLGSERICIAKLSDDLPGEGIVVGNAASLSDVHTWLLKIDENWMKAGAGDFYTAILHSSFKLKVQPTGHLHTPHLYVCGTAFPARQLFIRKIAKKNNCVSFISGGINDEWLAATTQLLKLQKRAVIAIGDSQLDALTLRHSMATAVADIVKKAKVREIFIEGGSTAAAVLKALNIQSLFPVSEIARGVVQMKTNDLFITVKPGSYDLPSAIADLYD